MHRTRETQPVHVACIYENQLPSTWRWRAQELSGWKISRGNFPGPVWEKERRRERRESIAQHEAKRSDEEKRRGRRGVERGPVGEARPSESLERRDRSKRLLGFGQCLATTANFSSPCGRTTVTFFRSKADRILSSVASPLLDVLERRSAILQKRLQQKILRKIFKNSLRMFLRMMWCIFKNFFHICYERNFFELHFEVGKFNAWVHAQS